MRAKVSNALSASKFSSLVEQSISTGHFAYCAYAWRIDAGKETVALVVHFQLRRFAELMDAAVSAPAAGAYGNGARNPLERCGELPGDFSARANADQPDLPLGRKGTQVQAAVARDGDPFVPARFFSGIVCKIQAPAAER